MVVSLSLPFLDMIVRFDAHLLRVLAQLSIPALSYLSCRSRAGWARWVPWRAVECAEEEMKKRLPMPVHTPQNGPNTLKVRNGMRLMSSLDGHETRLSTKLPQVVRVLQYSRRRAFSSASSLCTCSLSIAFHSTTSSASSATVHLNVPRRPRSWTYRPWRLRKEDRGRRRTSCTIDIHIKLPTLYLSTSTQIHQSSQFHP